MNKYYPVKLEPVFKDYIWGGVRLREEYNKKCDMDRVAESWELSAHKDGESRVLLDGREIGFSEYLELSGRDILGVNSAKYDYFPLLIKLIDAKGDLSVQVHPTDEYALRVEGEYGKTEMWYILDCDEGASLYYGFKNEITLEEYERAIRENTLTDLLRRVKVKRGDVFFIPAGTVHAIGKGIVICEVQQNSNTTYRVYDYGRRDKDGNTRQLHIEKALEVSSLCPAEAAPDIAADSDALLCDCNYFRVERRRIIGKGELRVTADSFVSLIVTEGEGELKYKDVSIGFVKGDSIFIPAQSSEMEIVGDCTVIDSRVN